MTATPEATFESALKPGARAVLQYGDWLLGAFVIGILVVLVASLPTLALDLAIAANIALSVAVLLVSLNTRSPLEFATFPTLLLFTTLFRLGLNVASTRQILTQGAAGHVIDAFGNIVVGGNIVIGLVVFSILLVIQFVVITKGSNRISEVAARFTLDAMPGKQMSIDADLNAGLITGEQARLRRDAIAREAEFYGAMDGAGKFVRGDAVAGLLITIINLIGGAVVGTVMEGRELADSIRHYAILSVGDGLVSQIPALLVSTASGIVVTKTSMEGRLSREMAMPFLSNPRALATSSAVLAGLALIPGLPKLPFLGLAALTYAFYSWTKDTEPIIEAERAKAQADAKPGAAASKEAAAAEGTDHKKVDDLLGVDRLAVEIGYRLIPLVDPGGGGGLLEHVAMLRRQFAQQEGFVVPPVRIRDNMQLEPTAYRILVGGEIVATGTLQPGHVLAMDPSGRAKPVQGIATTEPVFGLPAKWILQSNKQEAELLGYTLIDPISVLVTHVTEIIRSHAAELITRDDVKHLLETARKKTPAVVEELVPGMMTVGDVQKVLKQLLRERVPLKNLSVVLETLADHAASVKDPERLTEFARASLGRSICERLVGADGRISAVTLDPAAEARLASAMAPSAPNLDGAASALFLRRFVDGVLASTQEAAKVGRDPVLLVKAPLRRFVRDLVATSAPRLPVLSYNEVQSARGIEAVGVVKVTDESA
ncbi:MAG: flagellar biosynthesis protein FlhA [Planctomycetes bacterium]|nr:flagellar biosynthesis protein FlhA [Planctomycetota bacterium]